MKIIFHVFLKSIINLPLRKATSAQLCAFWHFYIFQMNIICNWFRQIPLILNLDSLALKLACQQNDFLSKETLMILISSINYGWDYLFTTFFNVLERKFSLYYSYHAKRSTPEDNIPSPHNHNQPKNPTFPHETIPVKLPHHTFWIIQVNTPFLIISQLAWIYS